MGRNLLVVLISAFAMPFMAPVGAEAVEVESGKIAEAFAGQDLSGIASLVLSGTMDARDFMYVSENMVSLSELDLSGVSVTEYSGKEPIIGNYSSYKKNALPPACFMGKGYRRVVLPASLEEVGECAFAGCRALESVDLPASVAAIGDMAFSGAEALGSVSGASGVVSIGDYAFSGCTALSSVSFPVVADIGLCAFRSCVSLRSFQCPASLRQIGSGAFEYSGLEAVDLSAASSLDGIGSWAFANTLSLSSAALAPGSAVWGDGVFFNSSSLEKLSLPESMTAISDFSFFGTAFDAVDFLPGSLRQIGDYAFSEASLVGSLLLPEGVGMIGDEAFRNMSGLSAIDARPVVPPALGSDVWHGVEKPQVVLTVPEMSVPSYKAADQWKDFYYAGLGGLRAGGRLQAVWSGNVLTVVSEAEPIAEATVYDLKGVLLSSKRTHAQSVAFDLGGRDDKAFVVRCVVEGNKAEYIKTGRN